jgi:long-subunit fatty acid transport protein
MYETPLNKKLKLRLGATAALSQNLNNWRDDYWSQFRFMSDGTQIIDTAYHSEQVRGKIKLPLMYSLGAQLMGNDKWSVGVDFSAAQWNQYRNFGAADSVANQTYRISLGGEYTPNPSSLYNYLQRVTYRLGGYYGTDYVSLRGTTLSYYALTFGASLPFRRSPDRIHTAIEIGKRGTENNGLIKENFFKFSLGISLNDKWFIKRKYD